MKTAKSLACAFLSVVLAWTAIPAVAQATTTACDDKQDVFERLDCELRVANYELQIRQTKAEMGQLGTSATEMAFDGQQQPASGALTLIRIYGKPGDLAAEFARGATVYSAKPGEIVTDECKLQRIYEGGAQLHCSGGGQQVLRLGHSYAPRRTATRAPIAAQAPHTQPVENSGIPMDAAATGAVAQ